MMGRGYGYTDYGPTQVPQPMRPAPMPGQMPMGRSVGVQVLGGMPQPMDPRRARMQALMAALRGR